MTPKLLSNLAVLGLAIALLCVYPAVGTSVLMSKPNLNQMSAGWQETCVWLRENTDPPADYYDVNSKPTWGVMSWWDYGYWITREGQRPAMTNPGSNVRWLVAEYLLSADYANVHDELVKRHIKYIIIDYLMVTSKFYAIDTLAHAPLGEQYLPTRYQQDYQFWDNGKQELVMLNYEEYYRSLVVRLYNFNGQPIRSPGTPVFQVGKDRTITGVKDFATYAEAMADQTGGIIAGSDPFLSPWPMDDTLQGYKLVWQSDSKVKMLNWIYPEVKIYEVME
jgi:asparagine N-glycosylation enzyme membrane subunit Stt3